MKKYISSEQTATQIGWSMDWTNFTLVDTLNTIGDVGLRLSEMHRESEIKGSLLYYHSTTVFEIADLDS